MGLNAEGLRGVFEREDLDEFLALLDPQVTWTWWELEPCCGNRYEVGARIEELLAEGQWGHPEIVGESGDHVVVDPHPDPPVDWAPELHHVYTFGDRRIVRMEDFPDRQSAFSAVGLE